MHVRRLVQFIGGLAGVVLLLAAVSHFKPPAQTYFWDRLFGTLYLPETEEEIRYGLWHDEHVEFHTLGALYLLPFKNVFGKLRRRGRTAKVASATPQRSQGRNAAKL